MWFEDFVNERFSQLSPGQRKVAEYLLNHLEEASYETAVRIAGGAGVSEATVVRLAYALGFNSFSDMQWQLRQQVLDTGRVRVSQAEAGTEQEDSLVQVLARDVAVIEGLKEKLRTEDIDQAIQRIIGADQVLVVGFRGIPRPGPMLRGASLGDAPFPVMRRPALSTGTAQSSRTAR